MAEFKQEHGIVNMKFNGLKLSKALATLDVRLEFIANTYQGTDRLLTWETDCSPGQSAVLVAGDCRISVDTVTRRCGDAWQLLTTFKVLEGKLPAAALGVKLKFESWSLKHYLLLPGAVYGGNRFPARSAGYPPLLQNQVDIGPDQPEIINDIPRLNISEGPSRIQQLTRDLTTPAVGVWNPQVKNGLWIHCPMATRFGDIGIDFEENAARSQSTLTFLTPCVRENFIYRIGKIESRPSPDQPRDLEPGMVVNLPLWLHFSRAERVPSFVAEFAANRKQHTGGHSSHCEFPMSAAAQLVAEKHNRENWHEALGIYASGVLLEGQPPHWQMGWIGGAMVTLPLLVGKDVLSRERAWRNLDFIFSQAIAPSGFFKGMFENGGWTDDSFGKAPPGTGRWHLLRKSADGLYFILRHFELLAATQPEREIPAAWEQGVQGCADAFVRLWEKYHQLGQFVDETTGDIIVGRSASAAIAPAGLALAARYFENPEYFRVAGEMARHLQEKYLAHGYTNGGPGEILQAPDSESCFGLLESAMALYEATGASEWLEMAEAAADLGATWVVSYNYRFPRASTFGALNLPTVGTVLANAQNKHAAPGICTLSGDSLLKLYRATGKLRYLELLRDIVCALPHFVSRADRPIAASGGNLPPGWMNERVNISDWLEPIGEVFYGSCWPEVSLLLTHLQVPSIYVQPDSGLLMVMDHVAAAWPADGNRERLVLTNPTDFNAEVTVMWDEKPMSTRLNPDEWQRVSLAPGQQTTLFLPKHNSTRTHTFQNRKAQHPPANFVAE